MTIIGPTSAHADLSKRYRKLPIPSAWPGGEGHFIYNLNQTKTVLEKVIATPGIGDPTRMASSALLHLELAKNLAEACDKTLNSMYWGTARADAKRKVWRQVLRLYVMILEELEEFYKWFNSWVDHLIDSGCFMEHVGLIEFDVTPPPYIAELGPVAISNHVFYTRYADSVTLKASLKSIRARAERFTVYRELLNRFPSDSAN